MTEEEKKPEAQTVEAEKLPQEQVEEAPAAVEAPKDE